MTKRKSVKAQSILEYAALVLIVGAAIGTMLLYLNRAIGPRVRHLNEELNESQR